MMALLSPRMWLALGLAAALAFSHAFVYRAGLASKQVDWDKSDAVKMAASRAAEQENRRMESLRSAKVIEAQNAQAKRTQSLQASAGAARSELDSLRNSVAAIAADVPRDPGAPGGNTASTAAGLLLECGRAYQELAAAADGHYSDAVTLRQAWPR